MDTVCEKEVRVHQGLNIKRIRMASQMKQEILAQKIGVVQQTMSKYENQEIVEDEILDKCAKALEVPVELLKNMPATESAPIQIFKDVNFNNAPFSVVDLSAQNNQPYNRNTYNYSEKVIYKALQDEIERLKSENDKLQGGK